MNKFKVGDKVRFENGAKEIIEEIDKRGFILGRYCDSGSLSSLFADPRDYTLIKKGGSMSKYEDFKERISKVTGWDKEADDILQEIGEDFAIACPCIDDFALILIMVVRYGYPEIGEKIRKVNVAAYFEYHNQSLFFICIIILSLSRIKNFGGLVLIIRKFFVFFNI